MTRSLVAAGILSAVCARLAWVCRDNRQAVQTAALVALTGWALTLLRL